MDSEQFTLLSVPEFAKALGVKPSCIRRWILLRKITVIKIGRLVRIPATELQRLIDSGLRPARPAK
jgi:excisionase family DNA binding protein